MVHISELPIYLYIVHSIKIFTGGILVNFKKALIGCFSILFATPFFARAMELNIPSINLNEDTEENCPICYENIQNEFVTPCRHKFCKKCIFHWLKKKNFCPICRECQLKRKIRIMECFADEDFIDVRDLPETKGKNFEEIIDFLEINYPNYRCTIFKAKDEIGGRVHGYYYGITDNDGHQLLVDTSYGRCKLGVYDVNYFKKRKSSKHKLYKMFELF